MRRTVPFFLGVLAFTQPARADKADSTLDISLSATGTLLHVDADRMRGQWLAPGTAGRIGMSLEGLRFGAGIGFFGVPGATSSAQGFRGPVWGIPIEIFAGYAFGSARKLQPYIEVRGAATHLFARMTTETGATDIASIDRRGARAG